MDYTHSWSSSCSIFYIATAMHTLYKVTKIIYLLAVVQVTPLPVYSGLQVQKKLSSAPMTSVQVASVS